MNEPAIIQTTETKTTDKLVQSLPNWDLNPPMIMIKKVVRK